MEWNHLLKSNRLGCANEPVEKDIRSEFLHDYDRIIFSPAFRRLHGKTQVFSFPESDMLHTRMTHSLETVSVGRSLGDMVAKENGLNSNDLNSIISAVCLAHDIGNPPFGHSGEDSIQEFFNSEKGEIFLKGLDVWEKADFQSFEGNAMGLYILTHSNPNITQVKGGLGLTYATLSAYVKYPRICLMNDINKDNVSEKKPGVFMASLEDFKMISNELGVPQKDKGNMWCRNPLSFLAEAADDICYRVLDYEDGYKYGLISFDVIEKSLMDIVRVGPESVTISGYTNIIDERNKIAFLRAKAINSLTQQAFCIFKENQKLILDGKYEKALLDEVPSKAVLEKIRNDSVEMIYSCKSIIKNEAAGFEVLGGLLEAFLGASKNKTLKSSKKILALLPEEVKFNFENRQYDAIMSIVSYVVGMTDAYAMDTYRVLKGIELPNY